MVGRERATAREAGGNVDGCGRQQEEKRESIDGRRRAEKHVGRGGGRTIRADERAGGGRRKRKRDENCRRLRVGGGRSELNGPTYRRYTTNGVEGSHDTGIQRYNTEYNTGHMTEVTILSDELLGGKWIRYDTADTNRIHHR